MRSLGIYSWFGYDLPLEKCLEMIKQAGFDSTCLFFCNKEQMEEKGEGYRAVEQVRGNGLTLDNIHAPYENSNRLWSQSSNDLALIYKELSTAISFCHRHRIPRVVMHLSEGPEPPPTTESGLKVIRDLVAQAESQGVTIALENTRRPDYLDWAFSHIQSSNLGFCYDSSHDFIRGQSRGRILEKWGRLLTTTHLSDNKGLNDDHLLPGYGNIDWMALGADFPKTTYRGALMLEVIEPDTSLSAGEFLRKGYQRLRQLAESWE